MSKKTVDIIHPWAFQILVVTNLPIQDVPVGQKKMCEKQDPHQGT